MEPYESIFMHYGITPLPADTVEAMAYVPFQPNSVDVYNPVQAFETGTMFPTLDKPFYGCKCGCDKCDD